MSDSAMPDSESHADTNACISAGKVHVAYVVLWFPLFTQPFIFREVECLSRFLPLEVYTLYGRNMRHWSERMRNYSGRVHRLGLGSLWAICLATLGAFCRKPLLMSRLFRKCCLRKWPNLEIFGENLWAFLTGAWLARNFVESGMDFIYAPWPRGAATAARVAAALSGLPYAIAARGDNLEPADPDLEDKFSEALFVRANNAADRARIEKFGNGAAEAKTELAYNILTLPIGERPPAKDRNTLRLLALGRFDVTKGFEDLLKACSILKKQGLNFRLTLAGGGGRVMGLGNLEERLRAMRTELDLEKEVAMPGLLSHDELPALFASHDVFLAPCVIHSSGRRDGIPNTVIEAMANALPVIATNVNALPEVVRDGQTGLTVEPGKPEQLALAVQRLAALPDWGSQLGQQGAALAGELFDCENNGRKLAEIITRHYASWKRAVDKCVE